MFARVFAGAVALAAMAAPAFAEVKAAAADGLVFQFKGQMAMPRDAAWTRLLAIGSWWSSAHTYSGDAANMSIDPVAGGCWCEMWSDGEVEHGRVISMMRNDVLRFQTALGPLQDTGVSAVMTFTLAEGPAAGTTSVTMDYNVVGSSLTNLTPLASPVDGVLQEQFNRLIKPVD
ncbi:MAG: hypothetical protein Q8R02_04495 [Hyphomonadaceae bacterium]|nr:hypothetical protein [Hyphomonadaceae bacterium]